MMDSQTFQTAVDIHGANPDTWPEPARAAMQAFAAAHPDKAEAILAEARRLDAVLASARDVRPSDLLIARIMAKAPRPVFADWRQAAAAAAMTLIVGVAGGYASGMLAASPGTEAEYYADAFGGLDVEWDISAGDGA